MRLVDKAMGVFCLIAVAGVAVGQERAESRGFKPESAFELGEIDSINLLNGMLTLEVPIGRRYSANGSLDYRLSLVYSSSVWDVRKVPFPEEPECTPKGRCSPAHWRKAIPNPVSNAGLGWLLTPGRLFAPHDPAEVPGTVHHLLSVVVPPVDDLIGGSVVSSPAGIDCGSQGDDCQVSFQEGLSVMLTPQADEGWHFETWGGAQDCLDGVVTMNEPKGCSAIFSESPVDGFDLTVDINPTSFPGSGSGRIVSIPAGIDCVSGGGVCVAPFAEDSTITLLAMPDSGSDLTTWNYVCEEDPEDRLRSTVELIANSKCVVRFDEIGGAGPYELTVRGAGGVVYVGVDGANAFSCPADEPSCTFTIAGQSGITLTAEHPEGLALRGWQPGEPCATTDFRLAGDLGCTARWNPRPPEDSGGYLTGGVLAAGEPVNDKAQWMYLSPDGSRHLFYGVMQPDQDDGDDTVHYSRDNTYMRLKTAMAEKVIEFSGGLTHRFEDAGDGIEFRLSRIEDRFGNFLSVSYEVNGDGAEVWTLTDSTGRSHQVFLAASALGPQIERVELAAFGGHRAVYTFHYQDRWIDRDCRDNYPDTAPKVQVPLLAEIELPEGATIDLRDSSGDPRYKLSCSGRVDEPPPVPVGKWNLSVLPFGLPGNEGWISSDVGDLGCALGPDGSVDGDCSVDLDVGEAVHLTAVPMGSSTDYEWVASSSPGCPSVEGLEGESIACNARFWCEGSDCGGVCTICPSCCECDEDDVCFPVPGPIGSGGEANESGPSGALLGLRLPTGGQIEWDYGLYRLPSPEAPFIDGLSGVRERRHLTAAGDLVGSWSYQSRPNKLPPYSGRDSSTWPTASSTDVVLPTGGCSRHFFSGRTDGSNGDDWTYGLPFSLDLPQDSRYLSSEVYAGSLDGSCTGSPLRSTWVRYEADEEVVPPAVAGIDDNGESKYNTNRRLQDSKTVYHDDGGHWVQIERSEFDGMGNYRRQVESGSLVGGDRREKFTRFTVDSFVPPHSVWLLGLFDQVDTVEGGTMRRTLSQFDRHTGFLQCRRTLLGTSRGPNDVLVVFEGDSRGNTISESWYGGDVQRLATSSTCSAPGLPTYRIEHSHEAGTLRSSRVAGADLWLLDLDIDVASGLPRKRRDSAGVETSLSYDLEGRLLEEESRDGVYTRYDYVAATGGRPAGVGVEKSRGFGGPGSGLLAAHEVEVDGFGRPVVERRKMPDLGWVDRRTTYNALGWKVSVSAWGDDAAKTRFEGYDLFGRPGRVELADGATILFAYDGDRRTRRSARVATAENDQSLVTTTEAYDSFGRLVSVTEPSGSDGSAQTTSYDYDVGGRLAAISAGQQVRRFAYDARGFLVAQTSPEKGLRGGGETTFEVHDARGLPRRLRDGSVTLEYRYDAAGRLLQVGSNRRVLEERTYDVAPGDGRGKLSQTVRHNWVRLPGSSEAVDVRVVEAHEYRGLDGRTSTRELAIGEARFRQSFEYHPLGAVSRLVYPACVEGCGPVPAGIASVGYKYELGWLRGVDDWLEQIEWHPSGLWSRSVHSNGVADILSVDGSLARPLRIRTDGAQSALGGSGDWDSGEFHYDDSGNITRIGGDRYWYDAVQRLSFADVDGVEEIYSYDRHGNLLAVTTNGSRRNIAVDPETNRLSAPGVAYDDRGQLTSFIGMGGTITYGLLGRPKELLRGEQVAQAYVYAADGERVLTIDALLGSLYTLRDLQGRALRLLRRLPSEGWRLELENVFAGDRLIGFVDGEDAVRHAHLDHLGTPRLHTDQDGRVTAVHTYRPFGLEITDGGQNGFPLKFTGHERDSGEPQSHLDDLDYVHARRFSPWWGRFLTTDPVEGNPARPQSWNRYAYVQNQPVSFRDRTGGYREDFHGEITEVVSLAAGYSPSMARAIAAATVGVDQGRRSPYRPGQQRLFHFTSIDRRLALLAEARAGGPEEIGTLLHAVQDSYSHAGIQAGWSNPLGHTGQSIRSWIGLGPDPDRTRDNPGKALDAARMTYSVLRQLGSEGGSVFGVSFERLQPGLRVALSSTGSRRQAAISQLRQLIAAERAHRLRHVMISLSLLRF